MTTNCLWLWQWTENICQDPWNCVTMHQSGVVTHLLRLIGSEDEDVQVCVQIIDLRSGNCWAFFYQEAAADCLQNIRKLALACEKFRYQHLKSWCIKTRALFRFEWSYCWTFRFLYLWMLLTLLFVQNKPFLMVSVVEIYHHKHMVRYINSE